MKKYKERRLYYFICTSCQKRATSFKRRRVRIELCRICRNPKNRVHPNQVALFGFPVRTDENIPKDSFRLNVIPARSIFNNPQC